MNLKNNFIALSTIVRREFTRVIRIWTQTLLPPIITQSLYFLIFGGFIGSQISDINGNSYMQFIVPGLIMMAIINNGFSNVSSSFFSTKFTRNIEELLVSPTSNWVIILGYSLGGILRALIVGICVYLIATIFVDIKIFNYYIILLFGLLTALLFSLVGLLNGMLANKFDDIAIIPTFILTPLTYLGGVFYSIKNLPEFWQKISQFNPIIYMIDGFRYGFFGQSDLNITYSISILLLFTTTLVVTNYIILKKGISLKS